MRNNDYEIPRKPRAHVHQNPPERPYVVGDLWTEKLGGDESITWRWSGTHWEEHVTLSRCTLENWG